MSISPGGDIIDDSDPRIIYKGAWQLGGRPGEHNVTTHGAQAAGDQAIRRLLPSMVNNSTLTYYSSASWFPGTSIKVYGTIVGNFNNGDPAGAPVTEYTIDSVTQGTFKGVPLAAIAQRQVFFNSSLLDAGREHTLIITNMLDGKNTVWLDFMEVRFDDNASMTKTTGQPTADTRTGSTIGPTSTSVDSSESMVKGSSGGRLSTGMIVGITLGVVGGVCLLLFIGFILVAMSRQRKHPKEQGSNSGRSNSSQHFLIINYVPNFQYRQFLRNKAEDTTYLVVYRWPRSMLRSTLAGASRNIVHS